MIITVDTDKESHEGLRRAIALLEEYIIARDEADRRARRAEMLAHEPALPPTPAPAPRAPPRIEIIPEELEAPPVRVEPKKQEPPKPEQKKPTMPNVPSGVQIY